MFRQENFVCEDHCMDAVAPKSDWLVRVGEKFVNLNYLRSEDVWNRKIMEGQHVKHTCTGFINTFPAPERVERSLYDIIEEDPLRSFDYIQREALKTQILLPRLAVFLSGKAIDVICDRIFTKKNIEEEFIELFYELFFITFLKRPYTWWSLHLLVKASKKYPQYFKSTLCLIIRDTHITSTVVQDFVGHCNSEDCTKYMKLVTEIQFTVEQFQHNLPSIYILYKKSERTEEMVQFMLSQLQLYSEPCAYSKDFGRLLLFFIQNTDGHPIRLSELQEMSDKHRTCYKSVCKAALDKFVADFMAAQERLLERTTFVIPKPSEDHQI